MMDSSGSTGVRFVAIIIAIASMAGCQATDPTAGVMNGARGESVLHGCVYCTRRQ